MTHSTDEQGSDSVVHDSALPLTQQFSSEQIETLLRTCAELYNNSDGDTGEYLSSRQRELAAELLRAWSRLQGDEDDEDDDSDDGDHSDGDGCAIYYTEYQVHANGDFESEVAVEDLKVGDTYNDPAFDDKGTWLTVDAVAVVRGEDGGTEVHVLTDPSESEDEHGEGGGRSDSAPVWADQDGSFTLSDGGPGNPGCDECGTEDAVVRVAGTYLCATAAQARGLQRPDSDEAHDDGEG